MPRTCTVCTNPNRAEIDAALIRSHPLRNVARRFGTSAAALHRHRNTCIATQLSKAKELSDVATASALVNELREITRKTAAILARAVHERHSDIALKAIARLERQLELKARLLGQLEERGGGQTTVQVVYVDKQVNVSAPVPAALPAGSEGRE